MLRQKAHHINGDGLDNRRCNLCAVTAREHKLLHPRVTS